MRAQVFTDPRLRKQAGRFVWLSIDTEKPGNAPFLERFPMDAWPTLFVIEPVEERAVLKWLGSAGHGDLVRLLADGERAVRLGAETAARSGPADAALARADRAHGARQVAEAIPLYREALARGGPGWAGRGRALGALLLAASEVEDWEGCARDGQAFLPGLARDGSFANAAALALSCALSAPESAPWRAAALDRLERLGREGLEAKGALEDDVAGLYGELASAREARGDAAGARAVAERWWRYLEERAARAPGPEARAAFDSARVEAALALGDPARAVPALLASEQALPADYNPPARLALLYRELGREDEALDAARRALSRVYGPRKLRVYELAASILARKGDRPGERALLSEAVAYGAALPPGQRGAREERILSKMQRRLGDEPGSGARP
ncbi:hypothetical protein [Anaeromyxobacter paludicola]|uniref:Tetratricopeptide repeat protein n=1 Tax=Anaeromyxobacter paludicola TaxID=2918171 RepID=A0ABN6N838_9BACT|nr:hypothetical protein [Anaeromyxobacter paludicola]BDG09339.1 hypothetical protein AMPC_24520 [Anaeromyxobacter paludicola]